MSPDVQTALIGLATAVVGGTVTWVTARLANRQSRAAAATQADVERERNDLETLRLLTERYDKDRESDAAKYTALERKYAVMETNQADLHRRIERLEDERDEHRRWRRLVLVYVHRLREYIAGIPGHVPPDPPDGLSLTELSDG